MNACLQADIVQEVEAGAAQKVYDLTLDELGPYNMNFTRSGRVMALAGRRGHLALLDWQQGKVITEVQVRLGPGAAHVLGKHQTCMKAQSDVGACYVVHL